MYAGSEGPDQTAPSRSLIWAVVAHLHDHRILSEETSAVGVGVT